MWKLCALPNLGAKETGGTLCPQGLLFYKVPENWIPGQKVLSQIRRMIFLLEDTLVLPQSQYFYDIIARRILNDRILTLTLLEAQMTSLKIRFLLVFWEQWEWRRPGQKSSLSLYILSSDRTEVQSCRFCHLHSSKMTSSQPEAH